MEIDSTGLGASKPDQVAQSLPGREGPPDLALHLAEVPGDSTPGFLFWWFFFNNFAINHFSAMLIIQSHF